MIGGSQEKKPNRGSLKKKIQTSPPPPRWLMAFAKIKCYAVIVDIPNMPNIGNISIPWLEVINHAFTFC